MLSVRTESVYAALLDLMTAMIMVAVMVYEAGAMSAKHKCDKGHGLP